MSSSRRGPRSLLLLHISDIHLREQEISSSQDVDEDLRAQLLSDVGRCGLPEGTRIDAILVTGDVAHGGKKIEYESARVWLHKLCEQVQCPKSQVWVVPGNHDIDRAAHTKNVMLRDMHNAIRKAPDPADALSERLREQLSAEALLSPLDEYNTFAQQFGCDTTVEKVFWESSDNEDDLVLNDGSHLRLRGINSSILSGKTGDNGPPQGPATEVVGLTQVQLRDEQEGICYLTLCHHPCEWLLDGDVAEDHLTSRAKIQLFGHKHRQRVRKVDDSLVVGAGALHPSRGEKGWEPRYNVLRLEVGGDPAGNRRLIVEVYQRGWKPADTTFGKVIDSDGAYPRKFELELKPWSPPDPEDAGTSLSAESESQSDAGSTEGTSMSTREIVFRFFDLSYPIRMQILITLKLLRDDDTGIADSELIRRVVARARDNSQLAELGDAIKSAS